ncbi:hypothetical protein [Thomasclavelia sp.]|uniref:hypothetical protein n=1 Tax=Thomasclavelia sp. TaxID=3025757 RepID=UPI0025F4612A|nr:hypothetical protein [Thomasclavelia sp.]
MEKIKKLWKEISIFGIVLVVFIGLIVYRKIVFVEYTTISQSELVEKVDDGDSFVVVIGNNSDTTTLSYQETMSKFVENHRSEKLYYVDISEDENYGNWLEEKLDITDSTIPQTIVFKDGKVKQSRTGAISYYRLTQLYK